MDPLAAPYLRPHRADGTVAAVDFAWAPWTDQQVLAASVHYGLAPTWLSPELAMATPGAKGIWRCHHERGTGEPVLLQGGRTNWCRACDKLLSDNNAFDPLAHLVNAVHRYAYWRLDPTDAHRALQVDLALHAANTHRYTPAYANVAAELNDVWDLQHCRDLVFDTARWTAAGAVGELDDSNATATTFACALVEGGDLDAAYAAAEYIAGWYPNEAGPLPQRGDVERAVAAALADTDRVFVAVTGPHGSIVNEPGLTHCGQQLLHLPAFTGTRGIVLEAVAPAAAAALKQLTETSVLYGASVWQAAPTTVATGPAEAVAELATEIINRAPRSGHLALPREALDAALALRNATPDVVALALELAQSWQLTGVDLVTSSTVLTAR